MEMWLATRKYWRSFHSPGATRIDLMVKDARGEYSTSSVNITVGSSAPKLSELSISVSSIVSQNPLRSSLP